MQIFSRESYEDRRARWETWRPWFAWRPVRVDQRRDNEPSDWRWLEWVELRWTVVGGWEDSSWVRRYRPRRGQGTTPT